MSDRPQNGLTVKTKPQAAVNVHFLGTCSGGGPIVSRNCSSLAVDFGNDVWLFDLADGTLGRLHQSSLKMSNISRIFITHMHGDHVLGLVAVLKQIMTGVGMSEEQLGELRKQGREKKAHIHIYGPPGVRRLVRLCLSMCSINLSGSYAVHELLEADQESSASCDDDELPANEAVGMDLKCDTDGVWRDVLEMGHGKSARGWSVSAGPLQHRVPCRGYMLLEPTPLLPLDTSTLIPLLTAEAPALAALSPPILHPLSILSRLTSLPSRPYTLPSGRILQPPSPSGIPARKLVIFGDCSGGTPNPTFERLCRDASLLVHECTNASIPPELQKGEKGRLVRVKGLEHSMVKKVEINKGEKLGEERRHGLAQFECDHDANNHGQLDLDQEERRGKLKEEEKVRRKETREKAHSRGHSAPEDVGQFAARINARRVVVNHFSAMFPSPRYPSSSPLTSILSPISPFPHPTPYPLQHCPDPPIPPHPLTEHELHLRIMMHSIVNQIAEASNGTSLVDSGTAVGAEAGTGSGAGAGAGTSTCTGTVEGASNGARNRDMEEHIQHTSGRTRPMIVAARDFMVLRIPSHELSQDETEKVDETWQEAEDVLDRWGAHGGVWIKDGRLCADPLSGKQGQEEAEWIGYHRP